MHAPAGKEIRGMVTITSDPPNSTRSPLTPGGTRDLLARAFPFGALDEPALADLDRHARWRSYDRGAHIGERAGGEDIFLVAAGRIHLVRYAPGGHSVLLKVCKAGSAFMFLGRDEDGAPRSCATVSEKETVVCRLGWRRVRAILDERPALAMAAFDLLLDHYRESLDRIEDLALYPLQGRMLRLLPRLARADPDHHVAWTHQELAEVLGASREEVGKMLRGFANKGLLMVTDHVRGFTVGLAAMEAYALRHADKSAAARSRPKRGAPGRGS